jgi:D-alanyl-D-alanine carboxypeptidase (penicillin-binding protein 5/6)
MHRLRRILAAAALCLLLLPFGAYAAAYSPPFETDAVSVYFINLASDDVIFEKDSLLPVDPQGLAQLMTVILTLENVSSPEAEMVSMKPSIENDMYTRSLELGKIRLAGLYRNETLSVDRLIYAVMITGANEAAAMLADYVGGGSIDYFVEMMNRRAKELGAADTHFTTPHGLPDEKAVTTAQDMAKIARHAMHIPALEKYLNVSFLDGGPTDRQEHLYWNTTNRLLVKTSEFYNPSITVLKESFSLSGGGHLLSFAERSGYSYLLAVMGCKSLNAQGQDVSSTSSFSDTNRLFGWAFDTFRVKVLLEKGRSFDEIPLKMNLKKDFLRVMSAEGFSMLVPDAIEASSVKFELSLPDYVRAPIAKGDFIGEVTLILADEVIGRIDVISAETVEASRALLLLESVIGVTRTFMFKFSAIFLLILIIAYTALAIISNRSRNYRRKNRRTRR